MQALQTTVNVTVTSEELTCLTNPSRHKDKEDSPGQDSDNQEERLNKTQLGKQGETYQEDTRLKTTQERRPNREEEDKVRRGPRLDRERRLKEEGKLQDNRPKEGPRQTSSLKVS